jgi:hypothetical protein
VSWFSSEPVVDGGADLESCDGAASELRVAVEADVDARLEGGVDGGCFREELADVELDPEAAAQVGGSAPVPVVGPESHLSVGVGAEVFLGLEAGDAAAGDGEAVSCGTEDALDGDVVRDVHHPAEPEGGEGELQADAESTFPLLGGGGGRLGGFLSGQGSGGQHREERGPGEDAGHRALSR